MMFLVAVAYKPGICWFQRAIIHADRLISIYSVYMPWRKPRRHAARAAHARLFSLRNHATDKAWESTLPDTLPRAHPEFVFLGA